MTRISTSSEELIIRSSETYRYSQDWERKNIPFSYFIACSLLCNNSVIVILFCGGLVRVRTYWKTLVCCLLSRRFFVVTKSSHWNCQEFCFFRYINPSHVENSKNGICRLSTLPLGVDGRVQGNSSRAVLALTRHQCNIHCESKRKWSPQTTRDTPKEVPKPIKQKWTELFEIFLIKYLETCFLSTLVFAYFKCLYFSHSSIRDFSRGCIYSSMLFRASPDFCTPLVVATTDLMFKKFLSFDGLTNVMLNWIWCGSEGSHDDCYLFAI